MGQTRARAHTHSTMGAAASVLSTIDEKHGVSDDCTTFISYFLSFCPLNPQGKTLRKAAWRVIDVNGNGYVSLAETGKWIKELLETQMVKLVRPQKERAGKLESNIQDQPRLKMRRTIQNCCTNVSIRVTSVPSLMPLTSGKMAKLVALKPQPRTITFRDTNSAFYAAISAFMLLCTMPSAS